MQSDKIRKYDSEIVVLKNDSWYFQGNEIIQEKVLDFFRKNLFEDDKGIFIQNSYGGRIENGYITSYGFPLQITNFVKDDDLLCFRGSDCVCIPVEEWDLYFREDERLFGMKKNQKFIKYSFSRDFINFISSYLKEKEGKYFLDIKSVILPIKKFQEKFEVEAPKF